MQASLKLWLCKQCFCKPFKVSERLGKNVLLILKDKINAWLRWAFHFLWFPHALLSTPCSYEYPLIEKTKGRIHTIKINKQFSLKYPYYDNLCSFTFICLKVNLFAAFPILLILYVLDLPIEVRNKTSKPWTSRWKTD